MNWLINRIKAFAYRNLIFVIRNFFAATEVFFWPIIGIISIGLMANFLQLKSEYINFLITGAIIAGVLQVSQLDVSYGFLYDVWSKSLKQTFIAPLKIYDIVIGSWIVGSLRGIITFIMLVLLSKWWFNFTLPKFSIILFAMTGIYLTAMQIGMTVIFFIFMFGQRIDIIAWMLSVLLMLICGIYYPVTFLPEWLMFISKFIPLTYFLEYFRSGYGFAMNFTHPLIKGYVLSFIYICLLFIIIEFAYKRAQKTGMIVKLSE